MFKLIKILNSAVNTGEPVKLTAAQGQSLKAGTLGILSDGALRPCGATETPTHLIGKYSADGNKIIAYPICPSMIFDCPISQSPDSLTVGSKVTLTVEDGAAVGVTAVTAGGVARIFDLCGATESGDTVSVCF